MNVFNFGTTFCKSMDVKELVTNVPLYGIVSGLSLMPKRWATKKTAGSTKNGRDSKPKNLGVKKFVRQRGTRLDTGDYVGIGKDPTLYALKEGCVKFERHKLSGRKWVHVIPEDGHVLHPVYATTASPDLKAAS
ncbi:50s ribosomal protein l27 [Quercus suber]|uniref:50s ribosomal protein l27 n=1 Tax=Quercus suber TaxID=58331 RepID=A0AAW0JRW3_QUESU